MAAKITGVTGTPDQPVEHPFAYANTYVRELLASGIERLRIGLRGGHAHALPMLGAALRAPYRLLCVLHTTRIGAPLGRYESPDMDGPEAAELFARFGAFFAEDARLDVWLHSPADAGTIVLDRYNLVYAYGPLGEFERILHEGGIQAVAHWAAPAVPSPHGLHYHEEWDAAERELLGACAWHRKPLHEGDIQYWPGPQAI